MPGRLTHQHCTVCLGVLSALILSTSVLAQDKVLKKKIPVQVKTRTKATPAKQRIETYLKVRLNIAPGKYRYVSINTAQLQQHLAKGKVDTPGALVDAKIKALTALLGTLNVRVTTLPKPGKKTRTQRMKRDQALASIGEKAPEILAHKLVYAATADKRKNSSFDTTFYARIPQSSLTVLKRKR